LYQRQAKQAVKVTWDDTENSYHKRGRWWVTDYKRKVKYIVYRDGEGKLICPCGRKPDCEHRKAIREYLNDNGGGNGSKITNECGSEHAKALQDKMNGQLNSQNNNGNGAQVPSQQPQSRLNRDDPFQECEQLDIDQIEGRLDGELVHRLSNGEYVISYKGIMTLADKHNIEFSVSLHDDTNTVIAKAMNGNSRVSGKEVNICGFATTASELAKRNAARQLIPLPEIKAIEKKVQLENEFDWQKAKAKCVELLSSALKDTPVVGTEANVDIIIHELVKDGKLRQDNPSHYNRTEWLIIHDACKQDASDDNNPSLRSRTGFGGDDTPSSGKFDTATPADNDREVRLCQVVWRTSAREHRQEFGCVENAIEFQNSLDPKFRDGSYIIDSKTGEVVKVDPDDDNPPGGRHGGNDDDGNNDDGGGPKPSSSLLAASCPTEARRDGTAANDEWKVKLQECKDTALNAQRFDWLKSDLQHEGVISDNPVKDWQDSDFETLKQACALDTSLFNRSLGDDFHIQKERNWGGYESSRRYRFWIVTKDTEELREKCFWCGKTKSQVELLGDDMIYWERYEVKISLCNECESTDTETLTQRFDELYHNGNGAVDATFLPKTSEEFVKRCKDAIDKVRASKEVEAVEESAHFRPLNEQPLESDNGKRKLQMDKKLRTWLVESDLTSKEISCREICEKFESEKNPNIVTRLRAGIDSGADISTVELD